MAESVREQALAYLRAHRVMTLATTGPRGLWAAAVFYASDGFDLIFLSAGHTRHAQNLAVQRRTAVTIQEDYADWPTIKGIQLEGDVFQLDGLARKAAMDLYRVRFPFLDTAPAAIRAALDRVNWYQVRPDRLYFIDNSKGFGHRDEVAV